MKGPRGAKEVSSFFFYFYFLIRVSFLGEERKVVKEGGC